MTETNENQSHGERRKYVRIATQNVIHCETYRITGHQQAPAKETVSKNISAGGILFESPTKYDIGEVLKLEIQLPGWQKHKPEFYKPNALSKADPLLALGTVVRIEAIAGGTYDIGVCLSGIDEGHQMAVDRFIKEQLKEQPRG